MVYLVRYALIALYTIVWGTLGVAIGLVDRSGEGVVWVGRQWIRWVLASCGIRVRVEGLDGLDTRGPYVMMSNHQSVFDVAAIVTSWPGRWRFVAKRELTWIPFFGWALALGGHVILDRSRHERAVKSLERSARQVRDGTTVIIFPEGTRSPTGRMIEFKSGGFHLAIQAQVPVLPISISGSRHITPKRSLRIESGTILIRYGTPIPTEGLGVDDRQELKSRVRAAIEAGFEPELHGIDAQEDAA